MFQLEKQIFAFLEKKKKASVWELLYYLDANESELRTVLNKMYEKKLIYSDKNGKIHLKKKIGIKFLEFCKCCNGRLFEKNAKFKKTLKKYLSLTDKYFPSADEWQQARILPEEAVAKAFLIQKNGDLDFSNVCILGDDDFLSVALALISDKTKIIVLDIDRGIIEALNKIAKRKRLPIKAYHYDARKRLPKRFIGKFDTVITDPPEAKIAMLTFLSRALELMKGKHSALYFGITHQESSLKKWNLFTKVLLERNLAITHALPGFCSYPDYSGSWSKYWQEFKFVKGLKFKVNKPDHCWYRATLFRLEAFDKPKKLNVKIPKDPEKFYLDEETETETASMF